MHRLAVAGLVATVFGCGAPSDPHEPDTAALENTGQDVLPAIAALLDSAAAAYEAGDYGEARRLYEGAVQLDSTHAAPWFGVYMAGHAMGDAAADSALIQARRLANTPVNGPETEAREP